MLKRIYLIVRIVAYIATLAGLVFLFLGRGMDSSFGEILQTVSAGCIVVGFGSFLVSYVIYMYLRFFK